jgi:hypothetical protein
MVCLRYFPIGLQGSGENFVASSGISGCEQSSGTLWRSPSLQPFDAGRSGVPTLDRLCHAVADWSASCGDPCPYRFFLRGARGRGAVRLAVVGDADAAGVLTQLHRGIGEGNDDGDDDDQPYDNLSTHAEAGLRPAKLPSPKVR